MMQILTLLRGKKTYIVVGCALIVASLHLVGVIGDGPTETALKVLGFGGFATLRAGIASALAEARAQAAPTTPPSA
jgi:hypothetical protein